MYNTKYECNYHKDNIFVGCENMTKDEKEFLSDITYKEDLIMIFNISENEGFDCLNDVLSKLYVKVKNNIELKECMIKAASKLMSSEEEDGLCILYSYDYMYLTHKCISEYLDKGTINKEYIKELNNILFL